MTPLAEAFVRLSLWRPHRALAIVYWYVTRRRVRARNRLRDALRDAPFRYGVETRIAERNGVVTAAMRDLVAGWPERPTFSIIAIPSRNHGAAWIDAVTRALFDQGYDRWELLVDDATAERDGSHDPRIRRLPLSSARSGSALKHAAETARGDYIIPLEDGVEPARTALLRFAETLRTQPEACILYGDEDTLGPDRQRSLPWFKPLWNAEMILAIDYVSHACALRTAEARAAIDDPVFAAGGSCYALLLAMTRGEGIVVKHVAHVTAQVPTATRACATSSRLATVTGFVEEAGATAEPGSHGTITVRWPMPDPMPEVVILIPTRDKLDLLRTCVDSVLEHTRYDRYRIVVIDNGSVEAATRSYLADTVSDSRVTVLSCPMPYNFSALNNLAVDSTDSPFLCFLNNDTEVIAGDWLGEMMRYAVRPGVGAVGAQLLYEDRSIQHAGVVMGLGNAAGHAHRGLPRGDAGYFAQAHAAHYASAVTAACLVVDRAKFMAVGGFDAEHLRIAYNDVDLCLKLGRAGWRNVYAPQATLLHLESKSRGADLSPAHLNRYMRELAVLQERWDTTRVVDPMHHPALDRGSETYQLIL